MVDDTISIPIVQMSVEMMRMTVENSISIAHSVLPNNSAVAEISPNIQPINLYQFQKRAANLCSRLFPSQVPVTWVVSENIKKALVHSGKHTPRWYRRYRWLHSPATTCT